MNKDVDDLIKKNTREGMQDRFVEVSVDDIINGKIITESVSTLEKPYPKATECYVGKSFHPKNKTCFFFVSGQKGSGNKNLPYNDDISNFTIEIKSIVRTKKTDFGVEKDITLLEIEICQDNIKKRVCIDSDDFYNNKRFRTFVINVIKKPNYDSKQIDLIRNAVVVLSTPKHINLNRGLGLNDEYTEYTTLTGKLDLKTGKIEETDNVLVANLLNNNNIETKKSIKELPDDRTEEVSNYLYNDLLYIHDPMVVMSAIASVILSWICTPLVERFGKNSIVAFVGETGSGKTVLARIANSFDGKPDATANFASTINSIQKDSHALKDHLLVIDDAKTETMTDTKEKEIARFLQSAYDGQARGRMTDSNPMNPRSRILITGENSLKLYKSSTGRIFEIQVTHYRDIKSK